MPIKMDAKQECLLKLTWRACFSELEASSVPEIWFPDMLANLEGLVTKVPAFNSAGE